MTELSKEQHLLIAMRKTLTAIIKDVTPPPGMRHPFSEATIQQVRQCLGLIAAREQELALEQGRGGERPYYSDERPDVQLVAFDTIKRRPN
ncbi:segregation and condensation protein A [Thermochromatium tepidum]|uniref:Segregation and condensation protein A n=1 Tax=Thermochromatium tepidum ATCC 43061 TaxID=316276 RepID=A0A6I6DVN8_THETI|nr:segregation and condensation protein A [Thermochromatium tepidum]QGU31551.1 segregation and condensation protein A [Thermochromatium tepidum ATCC 43061]